MFSLICPAGGAGGGGGADIEIEMDDQRAQSELTEKWGGNSFNFPVPRPGLDLTNPR